MKIARYIFYTGTMICLVLFARCLTNLYSRVLMLEVGYYQLVGAPIHSPLLPDNSASDDAPALLDAIAQVESGGRNISGDDGNAAGVYQIWKIYVDDVNRILGRLEYGYQDRWDEKKSREMVEIYLNWYATEQRLGHQPTYEDMARIHNGGPNGYKKASTMPYWEKVKEKLL